MPINRLPRPQGKLWNNRSGKQARRIWMRCKAQP